ncbi:16084_t:CDS:2, partial [Acaulospora morrowiae]
LSRQTGIEESNEFPCASCPDKSTQDLRMSTQTARLNFLKVVCIVGIRIELTNNKLVHSSEVSEYEVFQISRNFSGNLTSSNSAPVKKSLKIRKYLQITIPVSSDVIPIGPERTRLIEWSLSAEALSHVNHLLSNKQCPPLISVKVPGQHVACQLFGMMILRSQCMTSSPVLFDVSL